MEFLQKCYRSFWRLHEDRTILTEGRYFRAAEDAQYVTSPTYLASRNYQINALELPYGEWEGDQLYDPGTQPTIPPSGVPIGGNCLAELRTTSNEASPAQPTRGRCVELATRSVCGTSPIQSDFSIAYALTGVVRYFRQVPLFLTTDQGEGEWAGIVETLSLVPTYARLRLTEADGGALDWRFALCQEAGDPPPPVYPMTLLCFFYPDGIRLEWETLAVGVNPAPAYPELAVLNTTLTLTYDAFCTWRWSDGVVAVELNLTTATHWRLVWFWSGNQVAQYEGTFTSITTGATLDRTFWNGSYFFSVPLTVEFF